MECHSSYIGNRHQVGDVVMANPSVDRLERAAEVTSVAPNVARRLAISFLAMVLLMSTVVGGALAGPVTTALATTVVRHSGTFGFGKNPPVRPRFSSTLPIYTSNELFGESNPSALCYTCQAANITGSAPPSASLDIGGGVDTLTGDFSTSNDLFNSAGAINSLSVSLNYDAQLAQAEVTAGVSGASSFGVGWSSNFGASITPQSTGGASPSVTVNQANGSQVTFTQSANSGSSTSCPSGDYPTTNKYTVERTGSPSYHQWCALANVRGQLLDVDPAAFLFYRNGGQSEEDFAWNGSLTYQGPNPTIPANESLMYYNVAPGSQTNFTTNPE